MGDVELLLLRIDHFRDRAKYISVLREWLAELQIVNGRVISMGSDLQLLFVVSYESQNSKLLEFYGSRDIDTNSRGELCIDKFIDVLGRKKVVTCSCNGFLEMNVLSSTLLQKVLVHEWQAEQQWLDVALATKRTKSFLEWKEGAKAARKERRKKERQEKQQVREVKKREQEKMEAAAKEEAGDEDQEKQQEQDTKKEQKLEATAKKAIEEKELKEKQETVNVTSPKQGQKRKLQPSGQKSKNKKRRNKVASNRVVT